MGILCNSDTVRSLKEHTKRLLCFVNYYKWLSDAYVVEFFVKDHWNTIPKQWQDVLQDLEIDVMGSLLMQSPKAETSFCKVWPLSLLAYRSAAHALALSRTPRDTDDEIQHVLKKTKPCYEPLPHHYRRHVKPKKQYEISRLAKLIYGVSEQVLCKNLVDVGSGQGHLTRLLSFGYGLNITTVEAEGCHISGANKYDRKLKKFIDLKTIENPSKLKGIKQSEAIESLVPSHVIYRIDPSIAVDNFLTLISENKNSMLANGTAQQKGTPDLSDINDALQCVSSDLDNEKNSAAGHSEKQNDKFVFAGLHTCGDLGPTMLRVFTKCLNAKALVSVGCCYSKMTCKTVQPAQPPHRGKSCTHSDCIDEVKTQRIGGDDPTISQPVGFPMSCWLESIPNHELNYEPRELACHSVDIYCQRLRDEDPNIILQSYRAILEIVIQKQAPDLTQHHSGVRHIKKTMHNIKKGHDMPLESYISDALRKLGIPPISFAEFKDLRECLTRWKQHIAFHILRSLTAPVIESLILIDRMIYLHEQGIDSELIPLFDPKLSPRNFVLVALKNNE
ncbi:methyltransferase-like protein 25B [Saccoglossus kowalevskii]|uniref:Protein RRNAD1-like n=1 Tax=Saccoglossus kowalevskii TaxID=10224 RepID=A0ABM0MNA3_SACKO|nr:PREDICTED: protein RRNAD1-like [Saccoglossus kowalevskii]